MKPNEETKTNLATLATAVQRLRGHNDALEGVLAQTMVGPYAEGYQKGVEARCPRK